MVDNDRLRGKRQQPERGKCEAYQLERPTWSFFLATRRELYIGLRGFDLIYVGIFKSTEITTWGEMNIKVTDDFVITRQPDNQKVLIFLNTWFSRIINCEFKY